MIAPVLINIYDDRHNVSLLMEPPHNSFWFYANPEMPSALKKRVVDAYVLLHKRGVVHGAVEMHNILIGGDCGVTLMDFSAARSTVSIPGYDLGLGKAHSKDLDTELREVMYKLDYEGARNREDAKTARRAVAKQRLLEIENSKNVDTTEPDLDTIRPAEDRGESPFQLQRLEEWREAFSESTTRFDIPGQTEEQKLAATNDFRKCLKALADHQAKLANSPLLEESLLSRLPIPSTQCFFPSISARMLKRKAESESTMDSEPAPKRVRRDPSSSSPEQAPCKYECMFSSSILSQPFSIFHERRFFEVILNWDLRRASYGV